jgi:hypothetical protein
MGYMKSVDVVFNEYKLSDAQKNAVVELISGGFNTAKPNTIKSLVGRGLVEVDDLGVYSLEAAFHSAIRDAYSQPEPRVEENFHQKLMADVAELESALAGDPWKIGEQVTADEPYLEFNEERLADWERELLHTNGAPLADGVERFQNHWADWEKELAGFGETLNWSKTKVWDGLTATEIREDIETARPVGRKARRQYARIERKIARELVKLVAA